MINRRTPLAACATVVLAFVATACGGSDEGSSEGSSEATIEQRCEAAQGIKTAVENGENAETAEEIVAMLDAMAASIDKFEKIAPAEIDPQAELVLAQTQRMVDAVSAADGDPFTADLAFLDDSSEADQAQDELDAWAEATCGFTIG